jgi:hypothetical protein
VVLDAKTGKELRRIDAGRNRWLTDIEVSGPTVYVAMSELNAKQTGIDHPSLTAFVLRTGARLFSAAWRPVGSTVRRARAAAWAGESWASSRLGIDNDVIYAASSDGIVRAFSRANGAQLWHWSIGDWRSFHVVPRTGPNGSYLVVGKDKDVLVFERWVKKPAVHRVTISGVVKVDDSPRAGVPVLIGDTLKKTSKGGRFKVRLRTRGTVLIQAGRSCGDHDTSISGSAEVVIQSGRKDYRVTVSARSDACE